MKPLLWNFLNDTANGINDHLPVFLKERPVLVYTGLGFSLAYGATRLIQKTAEKFPSFYEKAFPVLEKIAKYGIPAAAVAYSAIDPQGAKNIIETCPVYTAGMIAAYAGGVVAVNQDLAKRNPAKDYVAKQSAPSTIDDKLPQ